MSCVWFCKIIKQCLVNEASRNVFASYQITVSRIPHKVEGVPNTVIESFNIFLTENTIKHQLKYSNRESKDG